MEDVSGTYSNIENGLRLLLALESDHLDAGEKSEVVDFIDAREYGVALETFSAILHEDRKVVDLRTAQVIQYLANMMDIHDDEAINSLIGDLPKQPQDSAVEVAPVRF